MFALKQVSKSRRCYSSSISQDFLKNVLERVKETTSKKAAPPTRNNRDMKAKDGRRPRQNNRKNNNYQSGSEGQIVQRTKPSINMKIVNRQPQFQRKQDATSAVAGESADSLIDALDSTNVSATKRKTRAPRKTQRNVPALAQNPTTINDIIAQAKRTTVSQQYVPIEPTPLSLLKYSPKLFHDSASRLKSYGLALLEQSNFPLYRPVNLGVAQFPDEKPVNVSLSPRSQFFGKYMPSSSLIWQKEKFLKTLSPEPDLDKFLASVKGERNPLKKLTKDEFKSLAKSEKKRDELAYNSEIVRLSVEHNNFDNTSKQLVFEVCSGIKPVAELKA